MRNVIAGLVLVALSTGAGRAHAQPADEPPHTDTGEKSVVMAYVVTVGATAVPLAIAAIASEDGGAHETTLGIIGLAGLVLGPSGGQWYAGAGFTPGLGLRLGGAALIGALAVRDPHFDQPTGTVLGLITATVALEAGVVWDLLTLPRQVRRHNRERSLHVAPMITGRGPTTGLTIGGVF